MSLNDLQMYFMAVGFFFLIVNFTVKIETKFSVFLFIYLFFITH